MAKIRDDLDGVVFVYDSHGIPLAKPLAAGDTVPEGAVVGDHLLDPASVDDVDSDAGEGGEGPQEPPREGRGSGKEKWQEYAKALDLAFPKDATRDQIIELVDAHLADPATGDGNPDGGDPADQGDGDEPKD